MIQVRDLFYNTPARMKFLKKDIAEGNAVEQLMIHLALSNPDVSFQLNRDDKCTLRTSGQGLYNTIFELYPRDMSSNLIKVEYNSENGILVNGYLVEPKYSRPSRSLQHISINGRYIKNRTIQASVEEACRSFVMQGKYPVFIIDVILPLSEVDVNVHPAKTEVRFKNEREVTSTVYHAIQNAIQGTFNKVDDYVFSHVVSSSDDEQKQPISYPNVSEGKIVRPSNAVLQPLKKDSFRKDQVSYSDYDLPFQSVTNTNLKNTIRPLEKENQFYSFEKDLIGEPESTLRVLGEAFQTYIIAQNDTNLIIIDMHAAHERILFEQLRDSTEKIDSQLLIEPVIITLMPDEKQALIDNKEVLTQLGFSVDEIGQKEVAVRETPTYLAMNGVESAVMEIAEQLVDSREELTFEAKEWLLHSVACRAAIKAGHRASKEEMISLTSKILCGSVPKYCPHGRPVYMMLSKAEIEKSCGRMT
ncbi:MAG: DNA mismatch repair endonuclease MutL, partial [Oscillospiraceae bacterium]|nr:DNA mismatch repair endonuclease MutL [Oscillospiraceae bacterium]